MGFRGIGLWVNLNIALTIAGTDPTGGATFIDLKYDLKISKELAKNNKETSSTFNNLKEQLSVEFSRTMSILNQDDFDIFADKIINARRIFC